MKLAVVLLGGMAAWGQSLTGLWDASIRSGELTVPFRFELETTSDRVAGSFFNGDEKVTSSAGSFREGVLRLTYDYLATTLEARLDSEGALDGAYGREGRQYPLHARRFAPSTLTESDVPSIAGLWQVGVKSAKGEAAWHLIVRQSGAEVSAAICGWTATPAHLRGRSATANSCSAIFRARGRRWWRLRRSPTARWRSCRTGGRR